MNRIKLDFWEYFRCEPEHEIEASAVQDGVAMLRLKGMYYEAHIQVLITYHADVLGQRLSKDAARKMIQDSDTDIDRESYLH